MNKKTGFTLIELIITLALLSIVAFMAIPNFSLMVRSSQVSTQTNSMLIAMQTARTEAVRRGVAVSVCPSRNQTSCGGNWVDGWLVVVDDNETGAVGVKEVLQYGPGVGPPIRVSEEPRYARFMGNGTRDMSDTANDMVWTIDFPNCQGDRTRLVSLNMLGRALSETGACDE